MGRIRNYFAARGIYWDKELQQLELSYGWAICAGFCFGVLVIMYISSFIP